MYSVGEMSSNSAPHPSDQQVEVAKNILRFVKSNVDVKLTLGGSGLIVLRAYSDASYITIGRCKSKTRRLFIPSIRLSSSRII
jgi:hypothetical protein